MRSRLTDRLHLALVVALLGLLPLLAVLQYGWLGELAEGEELRMRTNLEASVDHLVRDAGRTFEQLFDAFLLEPGDDVAAGLARQRALWRAESAHPGLPGDLYHVRFDPGGGLAIRRFDPETGTLGAVAWPPALASWRAYFELYGRGWRHSDVAAEAMLAASRARAAAPALAVPVPPEPFPRARGLLPPFDPEKGFILVCLDRTYLADRFFPALSRAYLARDGAVYEVAVVTPVGEPVYATQPGPVPATPADVEATFGPAAHVGSVTVFGRAGGWREIVYRVDSVRVTVHETNRVEAPPVLAGPRPATTRRALPPFSIAPDAVWTLRVQHRAGSLEAAVQGTRRRNVAVSLAVLAVLGLAGGSLVRSTRRQQALARQQLEFVAAVSHELRTPLAVIRSAGENLADGVVRTPERVRDYGRVIHDEGRRLTRMVEQVLALGGTDAGPGGFERAAVDVGDLVRRVADGCAAEARGAAPALHVDVAAALPPVEGDAYLLAIALRNLVENALKYGGDAPVDVSASDAGGVEVRVAVRDRGAGIPKKELARIFEPFYRGERARQDQVPGSGIGLSLARRIVEGHGGTLGVASAPGTGTTFEVRLPAVPGAGGAAA